MSLTVHDHSVQLPGGIQLDVGYLWVHHRRRPFRLATP